MATFVNDISRLRDVLRANSVDKMVDEDMLLALLELYASDEQRVDLVVLDLQGMLGKELSIRDQQNRWNEIKKRSDSPDEVTIDYENLIVNNQDVIVLPRNDGTVKNTPVTVHGQSATTLAFGQESNVKRKIPIRTSGNPSTSKAVPNVRNQVQATTSRIATTATVSVQGYETSLSAPRPPISSATGAYHSTPSSNQTISSEPITTLTTASTLISSAIVSSPSQVNQANPGIHRLIKIEDFEDERNLSLPRVSNDSTTTKEIREEMSIRFHKSILSVSPQLHIKYAAFKAAEFATLNDASMHLDEFIARTVLGGQQQVVKVGEVWDPPEGENPEQLRLYHHTYDSVIDGQLDFLIRTIPDADPDYLGEMVRNSNGEEEKIRTLVTQLLEGEKSYPSRTDYNKRKEYSELANRFFTVESFFELYDNPLKHFSDETRVTDHSYRDEALNQLKMDFRFASVASIRQAFCQHNYHYTPAFLELQLMQDKKTTRKTRRNLSEIMRTTPKDLFLIQEIAFARLQKDIEAHIKNKEQFRLDAVAAARENGSLADCPICCEDELVDLDLIKCPLGHGICRNCVRRQSEEQIGLMKNHVRCLSPDCPTEYTLNALKEVLGKSTFNRLEKRRQAEEVLAAGIEGLESCPSCDYCEVPREMDKLFHCQNPDCGKISCRECREGNHLPLRCEEHAMKQRLNNYVEAKMTDALLRECPACKRRFVKADGCNKMSCVCGAKICYVCRKQVTDYSHFANVQPQPNQGKLVIPPGKCPLYSDTNKLHEEEVAKSAKEARAELASKNPNIRIDLILGKK